MKETKRGKGGGQRILSLKFVLSKKKVKNTERASKGFKGVQCGM